MQSTNRRLVGLRDPQELESRLAELYTGLESAVRVACVTDTETPSLTSIDKKIVEGFLEKLSRGINSREEIDREYGLAYTEVVCETFLDVFNDSYVAAQYGTRPEAKEGIEAIKAHIKTLREEIGEYERSHYGQPLAAEQTFRKMLRHIIEKDLKPNHDSIVTSGEFKPDIRAQVGQAYSMLSRAVPAPEGTMIKAAYLLAAKGLAPFYRTNLQALFFGNDEAREQVEGFLIGYKIAQTVAKRYIEHRSDIFQQTL